MQQRNLIRSWILKNSYDGHDGNNWGNLKWTILDYSTVSTSRMSLTLVDPEASEA